MLGSTSCSGAAHRLATACSSTLRAALKDRHPLLAAPQRNTHTAKSGSDWLLLAEPSLQAGDCLNSTDAAVEGSSTVSCLSQGAC